MVRRRHRSEPPSARIDESFKCARIEPHPLETFAPLGDKARRTAAALAELAVQTQYMPVTWAAQDAIAEAAFHEILKAHQNAWKNGIEHGKWLLAQQVEDIQVEFHQLQQRFNALEREYGEAIQYSKASDEQNA